MNIQIIKCDLCAKVISDSSKLHAGEIHHRGVAIMEDVSDGKTPKRSAADMCEYCFGQLLDSWDSLKSMKPTTSK